MIDTTPDFYQSFCEEAQDDIDEIDMTNAYAFTWTPNPSKYPSSIPRKQYKSLLQYILLSSYKFFKYYCFVPELNMNGNVHIHGWFIIKDKIKFYKHFLPKCKQYGYVLVKNNINEKWFDYCNKEIDDVIQILGDDLPIPLTHLNNQAYIPEKGNRRVQSYNIKLQKRISVDLTKYFSKK